MSKTSDRSERRKQRLEVVYRAIDELKPDPANARQCSYRPGCLRRRLPGDDHRFGKRSEPSPRPPAGRKYTSKEVGMRSATAPEVPKRSADGIANRDSLTGDRGFESISLQRRVHCELAHSAVEPNLP